MFEHPINTEQQLLFASFWFGKKYITMCISILNEPKNCAPAPNHNEEAIFCTLFYDFV